MAGKAVPNIKGARVFPPPAKGFDALAATKDELARHGLPERPDPRTHSALAAWWEQRARRYQHYDHLEPKLIPDPQQPAAPVLTSFLSSFESCGFELLSNTAAITMFSGTWTVPNLNYSPPAVGNAPNEFRTFFGLGFVDLHVEMTVDAGQQVTTLVRAIPGGQLGIPVSPGDVVSATLCLQTNTAGTAFFGVVNETTRQTVNFTIQTHFPPAHIINAGVSRGGTWGPGEPPLARFGEVYFDELLAFTTNGTRLLTNGTPTTMVNSGGTTLAIPQKLNDFAFKAVRRGP